MLAFFQDLSLNTMFLNLDRGRYVLFLLVALGAAAGHGDRVLDRYEDQKIISQQL
jgi:hypothetical protein